MSTLGAQVWVSRCGSTAHVLKHGLLSVAAMTGGGGIGCPAGTTITGASGGSAGGTESGTESMLGLVQFRVAAEQLPARLQVRSRDSCFCEHAWYACTIPYLVAATLCFVSHGPWAHGALKSRPRLAR